MNTNSGNGSSNSSGGSEQCEGTIMMMKSREERILASAARINIIISFLPTSNQRQSMVAVAVVGGVVFAVAANASIHTFAIR